MIIFLAQVYVPENQSQDMKKNKTFQELFSFPGFRAGHQLQGQFGDPIARVIVLTRRKKRPCALGAASAIRHITIARSVKHATWMRQIIEFIYAMRNGVYLASGAEACE